MSAIFLIHGILIGPIETYFCAKFQLPRFLGSGDPDPHNFRGSARPKATNGISIQHSSMDACLIMDNLDMGRPTGSHLRKYVFFLDFDHTWYTYWTY